MRGLIQRNESPEKPGRFNLLLDRNQACRIGSVQT